MARAVTASRTHRLAAVAAALVIVFSAAVADAEKKVDYVGTLRLRNGVRNKLEACVEASLPDGTGGTTTIRLPYVTFDNTKEKIIVRDATCKLNDELLVDPNEVCAETFTIEGPSKDPWVSVRCCNANNKKNCYVGNVVDYDPVSRDEPPEYTSLCVDENENIGAAAYPGPLDGPWEVACRDTTFQPCVGIAWPPPSDLYCSAGTTCQDVTQRCPTKEYYACRWDDGSDFCDNNTPCTSFEWPTNAANQAACPPGMVCDSVCSPTH